MKLKNNIKIRENFYSSINISYDIGNQYMIDNYIPTSYSIEIIEDILLSIDKDSKDRARILVGAYGKGKSHILLVVLSILSKIESTNYNKILKNIETINPNLSEFIRIYLESDKRFLPVIIEKNYNSLEQSFLYALNESLKLNGLEELMPDTFYSSAVSTITMWEQNYSKTYSEFMRLIKMPVDEYINGLKNFNIDYYVKFTEIYPLLTSGSQFDPLLNLDVLEHYTEVSEKIKDYGYSGIFIVYDEFSKYLESSIDKISYSDLKLLQDFAELCNRSEKSQIHLTLVTHKNILNYINEDVNKEKIDGWKAISGRFKHIYIKTDTYKEMYQLISSALVVDEKFKKHIKKEYKEFFNKINDNKVLVNIFNNEDICLQEIIWDCFPLHPLTTYILPRISIKLGQNERTLFSFLTNREHNSVISLLEKEREDEFNLINPTNVFDFFESSILESNYKLKPYKSYRIAKKIIDRNSDNRLCIDILKVLILIYIVDEYQNLAPTRKNIVEILSSIGYEPIEIEKEIDSLIKSNNMIHQISNDYLLIKEDIGIDLESKIRDETEKIKVNKSLEDILNEVLVDKYLYPLRYNSNFEITRYFTINFIGFKDILNIKKLEEKLEKSNADGKVYVILAKDNKEILKAKKILSDNKDIDNRIIFIINKKYNKQLSIIYKYYAVLNLMKKSKEDRLLFEEFRLYLLDLNNVITNIINSFLLPELQKSNYIHEGKIQKISRRSHLTSLLSDICEDNYLMTPIINNESINKDYLSTAAYNSRNRLLDAILNNSLNEENLGLEGNRQEVSIMRSTLIQTGILENKNGKSVFNLKVKDKNMRNFLKHIEDFLLYTNNKGKRSFKDLYRIFFDKEHKIAMKTGSIPIYLAVVIRIYNRDLIISNEDEELDLSAELLEEINLNPHNYYIENLYWNKEKIDYLDSLWEIFKDYSYYGDDEYYKISQITDAMNSWYMSLSKYARESSEKIYLEGETIKFTPIEDNKLLFLNSVKSRIFKPRDFIFNNIPLIYGESNLEKLVINIKDTIDIYNNMDFILLDSLKLYIKRKFMNEGRSDRSLASVIRDWIESLDTSVKNHTFSGVNNAILKHFLNIDNDENKFTYELGHIVMGLRVDDWDNELVIDFANKIHKFKEEIENFAFEVDNKIDDKELYKIQFNEEDGIKTYKKIERSSRGNLLYNQLKSSLEMMGQAISEDEKRQILLDILYELS